MYKNKSELILEIRKTSKLFIDEFESIHENDLHLLTQDIDRTPAQMIAYQLGWMTLLMSWEQMEVEGYKVITPTPDYKWNNLGSLYESFYHAYKDYSLLQLKETFNNTVTEMITWIDGFSDEELFTQGARKWASSTPSNWPIWKWVHINTVAPFKSFRTKIRKWKRLNNQVF